MKCEYSLHQPANVSKQRIMYYVQLRIPNLTIAFRQTTDKAKWQFYAQTQKRLLTTGSFGFGVVDSLTYL